MQPLSKTITYLFTDIEADGPVPGLYSMLSFASVACSEDGQAISEFEANLEPLKEAKQHPDTMLWWQAQPEAWSYSTKDPKDPQQAIQQYITWIKSLPGEVVFTAHPASFDFMWINWYIWKFCGEKIFGGSALCIQSFLSGISGANFSESHRSRWPAEWLGEYAHTHKAIDDARGYAKAFFLMKERGRDFNGYFKE